MNVHEQYAITRYERKPISSEEVVKYLVFGDPTPHFPDFPSRLNLSDFSSYFYDLYQNYKNAPVFPNAEEILNQKKRMFPFHNHPAAQPYFDRMAEIYQTEAPGERGTVLYVDTDNLTLDQTPVEHGSFNETQADFNYIVARRGIPVFDIHTHPVPSFFSIQDFSAILINAFDDDSPLTRASAVLCPDRQIVAVATAETPLLDQDEFDDLAVTSRFSDAELRRLIELNRRRQSLDVIILNHHRSLEKSLYDYLENLDIEIGLNSKDEFERMYRPWLDEMCADEEQRFGPKLSRVAAKVHDAFHSYQKRVLTRNQIAFARTMNIKLYFSTNCADFVEFSA